MFNPTVDYQEKKRGSLNMIQQPWIIALISTDYDLKEERKAIIELLQDRGLQVSAFERPDFPVMECTHSHDNCLQALKRADIAILLINERYGGYYHAVNGVSITQKEYEGLDIPTIVLVKKAVWDERAIYRKQQKASGLNEDEFAESGKYKAINVDNVKIFRFIDEIQNSYDIYKRSNWINYWEDLDDLKMKIPEMLGSRSVTIIQWIIKEQIKEVKNRKTSTALTLSLGDVFDKGYYIEPSYSSKSGYINNTGTLVEEINEKLLNHESCLILGDAGAGKTTVMAKCFLEMAESMKEKPFVVPVYVWLKGMNLNSAFSIEEYLKDGCEKYLNKNYYPFFKTDGFYFIFFIDGFDELSEKLTKDDLKRLYSTEIFKSSIILTSRAQYADRYISNNDFTSKFSCCVKLSDWNTVTAERYISQFCLLQGKDEAFKQRIMALLVDNEDLHDILKSPLLITILLYVIEQNRMTIPETIKSRAQLFDECLNSLAQREIDNKIKGWETIPDNDELILQWAYLAWMLYENRLNGEDNILLSDALEKIKDVHSSLEWPGTVYEVIFDTYNEVVFGTFHEQFLEFLVAYVLVYACMDKKAPYPAFFKYVMRPEINRYFRGLVSKKTEKEQNKIFSNIKELYWECFGKSGAVNTLKRVHAVYYLSRLNVKGANDEITRIFNVEKEPAVLQSLYFGVIKRGDLNREKELYSLLNNDDKYSDSNRGYHLAYYGSISWHIEIPYKDDASISWDGPLRAFQRHFASRDIEHYRLRRIDLVTMRQFMEFRGTRKPLTDEILEVFEKQLEWIPHAVSSDYQKLIIDEFIKLRDSYNDLPL